MRRLTGDAAWLTAGNLLNLAVSLLLTPLLIDELGEEGFALWAIVGGLLAYLVVLDLGLTASLSRTVAEHATRGDWHRVGQLNAMGLALYAALGAVLVPVVALGDGPVFDAFDISPGLRDDATYLLWGTFAITVATLLLNVLRGLLVGIARIRTTVVAEVASQVVLVVALLSLLDAGAGLRGVVWAHALRVLTLAVVLVVASLRCVRPLLVWRWEASLRRQLLGFSGWMQLNNAFSLVNMQTDRLVIGAFVNVRTVASYEVGNRVALLSRTLPTQVLGALLPAMTRAHVEGDEQAVRRAYVQGTRAVMAMTLVLGGMSVAVAPLLFEVWLGRRLEGVELVLLLLLAGYAINNLTGVGTTLVRAQGEPKYEVPYGAVQTVTNVVLTLALAPAYGLWGVLWGTALGSLAGTVYFMLTSSRRSGFPLGEVLVPVARQFVAVVAAAGAVHAVMAQVPGSVSGDRLLGLAVVACGCLAFLALTAVAAALTGAVTRGELDRLRSRSAARSRVST